MEEMSITRKYITGLISTADAIGELEAKQKRITKEIERVFDYPTPIESQASIDRLNSFIVELQEQLAKRDNTISSLNQKLRRMAYHVK